MSLVSIIVPVYSVEKYLVRCVDSVLHQSFRNLQLILADDGSPDNCPAICDDYAERDSRVHVIHKKNGGLSSARNAALDWMMEASDSQWLFFLDSDDWLHPETVQRMLEAVELQNTKICSCGCFMNHGEEIKIQTSELKPQIWSVEDFYPEKRQDATIACAKLYHRSLFETLRFPEGKIHEDEYVTYRILYKEKKISYIPAGLYAYFFNDQGITKSIWGRKHLDACGAFEEQLSFFKEIQQKKALVSSLDNYLYNCLKLINETEKIGPQALTASECRSLKKKIRWLLSELRRQNSLDFDTYFSVLIVYEPVLTRLRMYAQAIKRRVGRI